MLNLSGIFFDSLFLLWITYIKRDFFFYNLSKYQAGDALFRISRGLRPSWERWTAGEVDGKSPAVGGDPLPPPDPP
jgi:hypothetical protein